MAFWSGHFQWSSILETTLDKDDIELESILDIDEILSELKNQNFKLINLFVFFFTYHQT